MPFNSKLAPTRYLAAPERYESIQYRRCGRSGLKLPPISLGLWQNFGDDRPLADSRAILRRAFDLGITHFDLANNYGPPYGSAEINFGRINAEDFASYRDELIISTKAGYDMWPGPYGEWGSRKYLLGSLDQSLQRMRLEYVDIFYSHRFDPDTPLEETMTALDTAVRSGKARYVGASSMFAWQFAKALFSADLHGWTRFVSMQDHYNLLQREEEREMLPLCEDQGVAVLPWSPLARGKLTRDWDEATTRSETDAFGQNLYDTSASDRVIAKRVAELADERGVPRAQVALAWLCAKPAVTSPIVGATKLEHLDDAAAAVELTLTPDEVARLEEPYEPHDVVGFA